MKIVAKFKFLSQDQKIKLNQLLSKNELDRIFSLDQLIAQLDITYSEALEILIVLDSDKLCESKLLIYHECNFKLLAGTIPFGKGFPDLPWQCPLCKKQVEDHDDMRFDFMIKIFENVRIV